VNRNAGTLRVFDTPADVAAALADTFVNCAKDAIAQRGSFAVSLAGGRTPKAAYMLLAQPSRASAIDWEKVQVYFGDERCVPPDDDQSNYKMAREAFLDAVKIPSWNVHRIRAEEEPAKAAEWYRDALVASFGTHPHLDLVMLGMGPDGHTASLVPGDPVLEVVDRPVAVTATAYGGHRRMTLTYPALARARQLLWLVSGEDKRAPLAALLDGDRKIPAGRVDAGASLVLADRAAAPERPGSVATQ